MRLLWLCNMRPSAVQEQLSGQKGGGLWVDNVLSSLRQRGDMTIRILCPAAAAGDGRLDEKCSYATFKEGLPYVYLPELEEQFRKEIVEYQPDVIHIWGTEYGHTLAMVNAAEKAGMLDRVAVHIQGLCSVIARHYAEGISYKIQRKNTFRDFVRRDNILRQQKKFALRGVLEVQALQKVRHVIGRTDWDEACTKQCHPGITYHFGNETLRQPFYDGQWRYEACEKHRIFASSASYPVKGFHYLLEAFAQIVKQYPDARLAVPGVSFIDYPAWRKSSYQKYLEALTRKYGIADRIEFLGDLSAEGMKAEYLKAHVFALPSTIENSPNSMGEAMLLGTPCVASDVGGVSTMLRHGQEGYVYQPAAPYMLAHYIMEVFAMKEQAEAMGAAAKKHAEQTHDPDKNLQDLLEIYHKIAM